MKIESVNNSKVKEWCKLKEKKWRDINNEFLIEGDHLLNEALKRNCVKAIISPYSKFALDNIPFYEVNTTIMKKLSSQVSSSDVIALCKKLDNQKLVGNVCLLESIQDPSNLGSIIRSAVAFNVNTIIMSNDTVDLYNDKVIRASEGMIFNLNFFKDDLRKVIKNLKLNDYQIYGTDVKNGVNLKKVNFIDKVAVIIGNEGNGMSNDLKKLCDALIHIPISKSCESLNAGIAASIIFYELNS